MGLSKPRANIPDYASGEPPRDGADLKAYEVFVQLERSKPFTHAGSLDAADDEMALLFAREHYGRDQECVAVWVVPRGAILRTDYDKDVVFRLSDQSYRFARGYNVGEKWRHYMTQKEYAEYKKEDLKEHF